MKSLWILVFFLTISYADVTLVASSKVIFDPVNLSENPKRIPQSIIRHYYYIRNDNSKVINNLVLRPKLDVGVFDFSGSVIMVDKKSLLKASKLDPNSGDMEIVLQSLPSYAEVTIMIDATLR